VGHVSHLLVFGVKSHEFQFLQIFQDDDITEAVSYPVGLAGRQHHVSWQNGWGFMGFKPCGLLTLPWTCHPGM